MEPTDSLKALQEHTNDGPLDWASLPGGPQFWNLTEDSYNEARKAIEEGHVVTEVAVDYNMCEQFDEIWGNSIIKVTN